MQQHLSWGKHIEDIHKKVGSALGMLRRVRDFLDHDTLVTMYESLILPHLDYGCVVWDGLDKGLSTRVQKLQNRAARIITRSSYDVRSTDILATLGWETLEKRRSNMKKKLMTKIMNGKAPKYLEDLFRPSQSNTALVLRDSENKLAVPQPKTDCFKQSFSYSGALLWNNVTATERKVARFFSRATS